MLFHVTMSHNAATCPAYHRETMPDLLLLAGDKIEALEKELGVKAHFIVWGAPEHVAFALLEADNLSSVARFVNAIPIQQEFRVTPVQHLKETLDMARALMAPG